MMSKRYWTLVIVSVLLAFAMACGLLSSDEVTPEPTEKPPPETVEEPTSTPLPTSTPRPTPTREPTEELPATEPESEGDGEGSLELTNGSDVAITELFISPGESAEWGANWLDAPLGAGETKTISGIPEDVYDLRASNPETELSETLYGLTLLGTESWTVVGTASVSENAVLRFEEDFSDNRNNWGGMEDSDVHHREPANGEYCIDIRISDMTAWEWYEPFRTEEYFAEVKCGVDPATDASCGIGFGPDGDNFVWYEVDASLQSYALFLLQDDEWQDALISWAEDLHISPDGENYLGLGQLGETMFVYVNGILIDSVETVFDEGRIGIGGATYEVPNVTVCLDELRVWQIE
jgi:hypothetical protein